MVLVVFSSFAIILLRKRELATFCAVAVSVLCFFLTMWRAGLRSVIMPFPGHTHLLFPYYRALFKLHKAQHIYMGSLSAILR